MEKQKITQLLQKQATNLSNEDVALLEKVAQQFPYFQSVHALLAEKKKLPKNKEAAAILTFERKKLKSLFDEKADTESKNITRVEKTILRKETTSIAPNEGSSKKVLETPKPTTSEQVNKEPNSSLNKKTEDKKRPEKIEKTSFQKKNLQKSTEVADELQNRLEELQKRKKMLKEMDFFPVEKQKETSSKPIDSTEPTQKKQSTPKNKKTDTSESSSKKKTLTPDSKTEKVTIKKNIQEQDQLQDQLKKVASSQAQEKSTKNTKTKPKKTPQEENKTKQPTNKQQNVDSIASDASTELEKKPLDFADTMLNYLDHLKKLPEIEKESVSEKKNTPTKKSTQEKVINNFIKNNPEITRFNTKVNSDKTDDLSHTSGIENTSLISENLAKINLKQGNKSKAIKIYEQLMLKYPEKKAYFAEEIKKIK